MNLPNRITIFRIILVPFLWLGLLCDNIPFQQLIVFTLFVVASISDFLDGYISRKYNLVTSLGKFLDPIADKILVNSILIILATQYKIPLICVLLMVSRDILVDAIRMNLSIKGIVVSAQLLGKLKTVCQMVAVTIALLPLPIPSIIITISMYIATLVSIISGIQYFMDYKDEVFK